MADDNIPDFSEAISDEKSVATRNWYNYWKRLSALIDQVQQISGDLISLFIRVAAIEAEIIPLLVPHSAQELAVTTFSISAITKANPCVMTIPGHTMVAGDFYFVKGVVGMTQVNFRWFLVQAVAGNNITVNDTGASAGALVDLGFLNSTGFSTYTSGGTVYPQTTRGVFTWPASITSAKVRLWGSGGAGGGSGWTQFGGAGGSGAYVEARVPRPVAGTSSFIIDRGMPGIQGNVLNSNLIFAGLTAFGTFTMTSPGPPAQFSGDCLAYGAGIGQQAAGISVGGDGGTPGIGTGAYVYLYQPGGQGGASPPTVPDSGAVLVNASMPAGATGAGGGGMGGNNGQDGLFPGGGGAPGTNVVTVDPGFDCTASACPLTGGREIGQSGAGAPGMIVVEW